MSTLETSKPQFTLLLGGTSHAGKSTLAERLCPPDGRVLHTDTLGPHPGRPWSMPGKPVKPHVAAHYRELTVPDLIADVMRHYEQKIWPQVVQQIESGDPPALVEGSALCPGFDLPSAETRRVFLTVEPDEMRRRMEIESRYGDRDDDERFLIDKFYARAIAFQQAMTPLAGQHGWEIVEDPTVFDV